MKRFLLIIVQVLLFSGVALSQATKVIYTCPMHPEVQQAKPGNCPKCGMTLEKKTIRVAAAKTTAKKSVKPPAVKSAVNKQGNGTGKSMATTKNSTGSDDVRAMVKEMKGMMQEMKSTVTELKSMVQELKGSDEQIDTAIQDNVPIDNVEPSKAVTKVVYACPMHPEVQSDKPGKCPKCGMTLVRKTIVVDLPNKQAEVQQPQSKVMYACPMHPEVVSDKPGTCPKCGMTLIRKTGSTSLNLNNNKQRSSELLLADEIIGDKVNMQVGKTVVYHLYVRDTMVNYTGKQKKAIAINGSIPAPTLTFTEGDTAEIYLHNQLKEETSLHWHGIILPNRFDGVPWLTTKPIHPGDTYLYKFKVVQNGTYWYHSHSSLQEQIGMYGALILNKREETSLRPSPLQGEGRKEVNVVLSEWADENPMQTQRRLRTANDWFAIKKGSTQSYLEAIKEGHFKTKLINEWKRMKAMDVSDDWYQKFLMNGKPETAAPQFKAGDKVTLHVVNAGASSYFWLGYGGGKITVVGNDGNEVLPVEVDRLIIAPAETYDVVVTIPENMTYEFRATSEDRTGASSLWLGTGMKMPAPKLPRLKYFDGMKMMNAMMNVDGTMKEMGMNMSLQKMDMNTVMYPEITGGTGNTAASGNNKATLSDDMGRTQHDIHNIESSVGADIVTLNYDMLRSPVKTSLPERGTRTLNFTLTGNMNRYVWTLDNKTVTEADRIMINKGENLRLILTNNSMMRHPMHLHGHDFRVLNSSGEYSPMKNVIDIMPMETDTIEFAANQEGNWFFHCHILFHMMAGMGRVFTYANSPVNPDLPNAEEAYTKFRKHKDNNMKHLMARIGLESNGSDGEAMVSTNRYALITEWRLGMNPHHGYESETMFGKYIGVNQWLFPYVGFDYHKNEMKNESEKNLFSQYSNQNNRKTFTVGVQYITPGLFIADARIDGKGKFRFELSREDIPITPRLRFNIMGNTDKEYMAGFRYVLSKWLTTSTHYDSDMGFGAGVTITY